MYCTDFIWDFTLRLSDLFFLWPRFQLLQALTRRNGNSGLQCELSQSVRLLRSCHFFPRNCQWDSITHVETTSGEKTLMNILKNLGYSLLQESFTSTYNMRTGHDTRACATTQYNMELRFLTKTGLSRPFAQQTCRFAVICRILPAQIGGGQEGPKVKPTLLLLRQIYVWSLFSACLDSLATRVTGIGTKH